MRRRLLPVNEIFYSLQGEGLRTGESSLFVRLAGCNLNCWFCDTEIKSYEELSVSSIVDRLYRQNSECEWVVLTGGEPLAQETAALEELLESLKAAGYKVQLETNGTWPTDLDFDHITVSPKQGYIHPGLKRSKIKEIKVLVENGDDPQIYLAGVPHFLQPIDSGNIAETKNNIEYCRKLAAANPRKWQLSLQMHKILGIK